MSEVNAMSSGAAPSKHRRRFAVTALLLLTLAFPIARSIWQRVAQQRLDAALAAARVSGDPLTIAELFPSRDPDPAHNAVPLILGAIAQLNSSTPPPSESTIRYNDYPPFPPEWHQAADGAIANNAQMLKLIRDARDKSSVYWSNSNTIPPGAFSPTLGSSRNLCDLLGDAALHAQIHGDDVEALARISDIMHIARAVRSQHSLNATLMALGMDSVAAQRLEVIAPGLRIKSGDERDPLRQQARELIRQLTDRDAHATELRRAIVAERVAQIETIRGHADHSWWLGPMYTLDLANALKVDDVLIKASSEPHWPTMEAALAPFPNRFRPGVPPKFGTMFSIPRDPPDFARNFSEGIYLYQVMLSTMVWRTEQHMSAVSLAMQLYRADHNGAWPEKLDALVPAYLPRVPEDPLGPQGAIIDLHIVKAGLPNGSDRVLIHSVGLNGIDEANNPRAIPTVPTYSWLNGRRSPDDQFVDLSLWTPPPAATQKGEE